MFPASGHGRVGAPAGGDDAAEPLSFDVTEADFLQPGATQVAAGYAIYGPVTMLVLSVGNGVAERVKRSTLDILLMGPATLLAARIARPLTAMLRG